MGGWIDSACPPKGACVCKHCIWKQKPGRAFPVASLLFLVLFPFLTLHERSCWRWCSWLYSTRPTVASALRFLLAFQGSSVPPYLVWSCLLPTPVPVAIPTCPNVHPCSAFRSDVSQVTAPGHGNVPNITLWVPGGI